MGVIGGRAFFLQEVINLVEVLKDSLSLVAFIEYFIGKFENVVGRLLSHNSVVSLEGDSWGVVFN